MSRHPLEAYAESYEIMGRTGPGTVHPDCVATDIRQNMIPATQAIAPPVAAGSVDTPSYVCLREDRDEWRRRAEKAEDALEDWIHTNRIDELQRSLVDSQNLAQACLHLIGELEPKLAGALIRIADMEPKLKRNIDAAQRLLLRAEKAESFLPRKMTPEMREAMWEGITKHGLSNLEYWIEELYNDIRTAAINQ